MSRHDEIVVSISHVICASINNPHQDQFFTNVRMGSNNNNTVSWNIANAGSGEELSAKITAQGDLVRQLKGDKKPKEEIDAAVKTLLALKVNILLYK